VAQAKPKEEPRRPVEQSKPKAEPRRPLAQAKPKEEPRRRPADRPRERDEDIPPPRRASRRTGPRFPLMLAAVGGGAGLFLLVLVAGLFIAFLPRAESNPPDAPPAAEPPPPPLPPRAEVPAGPAPPQIEPATVAKVKDATAYLRVQLPNGGVAEGSGFFCLEPGVVMTNAHVLGMLRPDATPPSQVDVVVHSGETNENKMTGTVLGVDRTNDLAVLRVPADAGRLPAPLPVDSATKLIETQKVYIFGFPLGAQLGKNITVSESSVSSLRRDEAGVLTQVQVNGGMHAGNSGGPVVDSRGAVVGVSVAIIRGTQINFAIPGDFVVQLLDGKSAGSELGAPYRADNGLTLPLKLTCLDPLGRVRSVKVEVWAGNPGKPRPAGTRAPDRQPGDDSPQTCPLTGRDGAYAADVRLPSLKPGQVCWLRPVLVNAAGATLWDAATPVTPDALTVLEHRPALIRFAAPADVTDRTLRLTNNVVVTAYRDNDSLVMTQKMEGDALETSNPDARGKGTAVRLTIGKCSFSREVPGKSPKPPPEAERLLSQFSPTFLVDANHACKEIGNRNFNVLDAQYRETVQAMFETVCNVFEATTLPVPNRELQPSETWPARVPMLVRTEGKPKLQDLHLTCTYEGLRSADGRNEAFVALSGVAKSRGPRPAVLGKVTGQAVVDVDRGLLTKVKLTVNSEMEVEDKGLRILVSDESMVTRGEGNSLGITRATKNQPGAK
jgi:S1-C subfamily serine protease